jgi:serine/alanine adding enzyme
MNIQLTNDSVGWDEYARKIAPDNLYYQWVWREVIQETFGHEAYYLIATDVGTICGALPLVAIRSRLFGNSLVSIPFFSSGGLLADSEEVRNELLAHAAELAREQNARHIELRQGDECEIEWVRTSIKVRMELKLPSTADDYLSQLSSSRRKRLRYILKHGLDAEWAGMDAVPAFYEIFATNMRNLGTPVYPRVFFENQIRHLPDHVRVLIVRDAGKPVAAAFLTSHGATLELPWAASLPESRKKEAPMIMYWTIIQRAIEEGFKTLDLGRCTPGSGNYMFKQHWNPVERPLHWYYWLAPGTSIPHLRPDNSKFKLAVELWKRLPLIVANGLGPHVVRSIP